MNQSKEVNRPGSVLIISAIIVGLFVLWGALSPGSLESASGQGLGWMIENFGWFYMLSTAFFVFFVIVIAISPFGRLRLGKPDERPQYSWFSWIGMLFAAGIGVGFVFWGVAEPVLYYLDTPMGYTPETPEAAVAGLRYAVYHWALHPWAIFSIVGLTLAYVQYRKDRPGLISSAFYPLIGDRINGWAGRSIDILAVIATCTGVATTFGLSALQITGGISHISPIPNSVLTQIIVIIIVTFLFMFSAATGVDKGIKILSNINLILAGLLLLFVIIFGPTLFIAESFVTTLGGYITNVTSMSLTMTPFTESEWLGTNTIFFWAWHISWAPFMGIFIARISRGRTIREFMAGVLIVPSILAVLWFTTFGGTALYLEISGAAPIGDLVMNNVEVALFTTLAELPLSGITNVLAVILIAIFFITSADSASYVLGAMTSNGSLNPRLSVKLLWGFLIAGTASVLLVSGGGGLQALQTASIIAALPFAIIMTIMIISILVMFGKDYKQEGMKRRRKRMKKLKEEIREEFYEDMKEEVYEEIKEDVKEEVYEEFKEDMKEKVYEEIKEDLYNDLDIDQNKKNKDK
ncbi:BCCT family transporter [Halalkalibacter nanhaiisediminis]|uniref:Glycine betaine transporter n=1 Tax=Halalkalibacter nanhaiisediminis TaxID=688079 RepID=A0A562QP71_9BACI|nr:BCCT family transporter [Halalkalibacter nanhaiisediminis]TWI57856.1 glycine betaine transporter [Halalkalibacter nanhaiisediminis]